MLQKPRVLLAWEYGRNLGHLSCLAAVASCAQKLGWESLGVLPLSKLTSLEIAKLPFQATAVPPLYPSQKSPNKMMLSFADILLNIGFEDFEFLKSSVIGWLNILKEFSPKLLIVDYAPRALLAAYLLDWPAVQISNGFDAPTGSCPPFGHGRGIPGIEKNNEKNIALLERNLSRVAQSLGIKKEISLERILNYPRRLIARIPEVDPYGFRKDVEYIGPLNKLTDVEAAVWPAALSKRPKVFAYFRNNPILDHILNGLLKARISTLCFCPDYAGDISSFGNDVRIVNKPVFIPDALKMADAVIGYGSTTLSCQALLAGKPQLIAPADLEKWISATKIEELGAGLLLKKISDIDKSLDLLFDKSMQNSAAAIAARYRHIDWAKTLENTLQNIFFRENKFSSNFIC